MNTPDVPGPGQRRPTRAQSRWRAPVLAAAVASAALAGVSGLGAMVQAQAAVRSPAGITRPAAGVTFTVASGGGTVFDTSTDICFEPNPLPKSVQDDPANYSCSWLPDLSGAHPYNVDQPYPGWATPVANSRWVGPQRDGSDGDESAQKWYIYHTTFTVRACATLQGNAMADNAVGVFVDHRLLAAQRDPLPPTASNFQNPLTFSSGGVNLKPGTHLVDFVVHDVAQPATGLDYSFQVATHPNRSC